MAWRWIYGAGDATNARAVDINGKEFSLGAIPRPAREELSNLLEVRGAVWGILYAARQAFAAGVANYDDAVDNLSTLVVQLHKAQQLVHDVLQGVAAYVGTDVFATFPTLAEQIPFAKELLRYAPEPAGAESATK